MKTLLIMRHAKSDWNAPGLGDHDRPLNKRGKHDAPRMGSLLKERSLVPDLIASSTAKRALKTAQKVARACGYQGEIETHARLYHGELEDKRAILRYAPEDCDTVLMVAHNPGQEDLLKSLTKEYRRMPTAALVEVRLDLDAWNGFDFKTRGTLVNFWLPREIPD